MQQNRAVVHWNTELLFEVAIHPHIVVANEHRDGDASVGKFGQLSQQAGVAFGNNRLIFKPEIKQITQ